MARTATAALVGLLLLAATPHAQNNGLAGAWDLNVNGPQGSITVGATFKQDGDKVSGTLSSPQGEVECSGTIKGKELSLAFTVQTPQGPIDIRMTAEVDGASMKGVMDFGQGTADFTGTRK
jgi:hypothetical protein